MQRTHKRPAQSWLARRRHGRPIRWLAARGESPAAFGGRGILSGGVAPRSNMPNILPRRALPARRLAHLGATRDFHHGLLGLIVVVVGLLKPDAVGAQVLPAEPFALAGGRLVVSGEVTATVAPEDTGYFNYTEVSRHSRSPVRASVRRK